MQNDVIYLLCDPCCNYPAVLFYCLPMIQLLLSISLHLSIICMLYLSIAEVLTVLNDLDEASKRKIDILEHFVVSNCT